MFFLFKAEDGIRDLVRSRGLGDVYKRQGQIILNDGFTSITSQRDGDPDDDILQSVFSLTEHCLLYTSDAADERSSVDLGGRRIIKKKKSVY